MKQILPIASKVQKPIAIASSMSRLLKDIESRPLGAREHQQVPKQLSAVKRILPCGQLLSQAFAGRDSGAFQASRNAAASLSSCALSPAQ